MEHVLMLHPAMLVRFIHVMMIQLDNVEKGLALQRLFEEICL